MEAHCSITQRLLSAQPKRFIVPLLRLASSYSAFYHCLADIWLCFTVYLTEAIEHPMRNGAVPIIGDLTFDIYNGYLDYLFWNCGAYFPWNAAIPLFTIFGVLDFDQSL